MQFIDPVDPKKLLPSKVRDTPAWRDLADAMREAFSNIVDGRDLLQRIRDPFKYRRGRFLRINGQLFKIEDVEHFTSTYPSPALPEAMVLSDGFGRLIRVSGVNATNDRYVLIRNANELGYNVIAERLNDEDYARLNESLGEFYHQKGAKGFVHYIGFVKNVRLKIVPLWSQVQEGFDGYINLTDAPGKPVWDGGDWFPTSHFDIEYDAVKYKNFSDADFLELFEKFAPINYVLKRFTVVNYVENIDEAIYVYVPGVIDHSLTVLAPNDESEWHEGNFYLWHGLVGEINMDHLPVNT